MTTVAALPLPEFLDRPHVFAIVVKPCAGRQLHTAVVRRCVCAEGHIYRTREVAKLYSARVIRRCPVLGVKVTLDPRRRATWRRGA